jgi:hypothetical protein
MAVVNKSGLIQSNGIMPCSLEASLPTLEFDIGSVKYQLEPSW